jgi:FAD/FMN-containing dehydrogenase
VTGPASPTAQLKPSVVGDSATPIERIASTIDVPGPSWHGCCRTCGAGLAVPAGIISTTGIAGLTLSGGHGYLSRKYGLTIDNLLEADVVLADGSFVTASTEKNPVLLWALRGGGGNFGVATSFLFQLHSVKMVFAGPIAWDQKHARIIMQRYREFLPQAPEDLGAFVGLKKIPSSAPFPQEI